MAEGTNPESPRVRVLIIDDEAMIRAYVRAALEQDRYLVSEAADALAGIAAVRIATMPFDLILLDLTLPGGQGTEIVPALRQLAPATRILVISGHHEDDCNWTGADGFLGKPFVKSTLLTAVRAVLSAPTHGSGTHPIVD